MPAMQLIAAALAYNVDLIGAKSVFRRVGFTLHLEFLDSVLRQNDGRGVQGSVSVNQSVQCVIVRFRPAAIDADGVSLPLPHLPLLAGGLHRPGAMNNKFRKLRPLRGNCSTCVWLTSCATAALSVSRDTELASTCTVSETWPGFMMTFTRACCATARVDVVQPPPSGIPAPRP